MPPYRQGSTTASLPETLRADAKRVRFYLQRAGCCGIELITLAKWQRAMTGEGHEDFLENHFGMCIGISEVLSSKGMVMLTGATIQSTSKGLNRDFPLGLSPSTNRNCGSAYGHTLLYHLQQEL